MKIVKLIIIIIKENKEYINKIKRERAICMATNKHILLVGIEYSI